MSGRAFGDAALGDPGFVSSLRRGRSPCVSTLDPVLEFMGDAPLGPAFRREVETYLSVTGLKRSVLGARALGNPSFVSQLFGSLSPTLRTVAQGARVDEGPRQCRGVATDRVPRTADAGLAVGDAGEMALSCQRVRYRIRYRCRCRRSAGSRPRWLQLQGRLAWTPARPRPGRG